MQRLLCLLSNVNRGGAETFLMKIYRTMDTSRYQMDFCINVPEKCDYEDEILSMGGRIYRIPPKSENPRAFRWQLTNIIRENGYKNVLRITSNAAGFWDLKIAKRAGAAHTIARSSNASDGGGWKTLLSHQVGRFLWMRYVDTKIAPSDLAAKYTFGQKAYQRGEVKMLHNGVDLNEFKYDEIARKKVRSEFNIPETAFVIGHVGRFNTQKNHRFLIEIFAEAEKQQKDAILLLVGVGTLTDEIRSKVSALNLTEKVIFAGLRSDIPDVLSAMDVFVFPSLYEGMPNTIIEAQACGLPCLISDKITREVGITDLVAFASLDRSALFWAHRTLETRNPGRRASQEMMRVCGYDIQSVTDAFIPLVFE